MNDTLKALLNEFKKATRLLKQLNAQMLVFDKHLDKTNKQVILVAVVNIITLIVICAMIFWR